MAISSAQVEGLTLYLQPVKAPDHGYDQAPAKIKSLCVCLDLSHFTGGLVQSFTMLSKDINVRMSHTRTSILGAY